MKHLMNIKACLCLAVLVGGAALIALATFPKSAWGQTQISASVPARSRWTTDQRLTFNPADSLLSINLARNIAADDAGRVHLVWFDKRDGNPQVYYKRSPNGGQSWEPDVRLSQDPAWREHPAIAVSGNRVYVVWHDARNEGLNIYFKSSSDGGLTWSGEIPLTTDNGSSFASIAAEGETVQVIWSGHLEGQSEIYASHSTDAGLSWSIANRLSDASFDSWTPTIAVSRQFVYAAWVDTQDGNEEEYFCRSTDGGVTWGPVMRLTNNRANSWAPSLVGSGNTVHLVWFDQQDSPIQPLDAEEKLNEIMRLLNLTVEPTPAGVMVTNPELAAQRRVTEKYRLIESVVLRWIARGGDVLKLQTILQQFEALNQQGASYLEQDRKLDEALKLMALSYSPSPTDDLPKIHYQEAMNIRLQDKLKQIQVATAAWVQRGGNQQQLETMLREFQRALTTATTEWEVYYRRSTDGGQNWEPTTRMTNAPLPSARPNIALVGNYLHLVWFDYRDGNAEIYYKHSPDAGTNWMPEERLTVSPGDSLHPMIAVNSGSAHVSWFDTRDGNSEIYYKQLRQSSNLRSLPSR